MLRKTLRVVLIIFGIVLGCFLIVVIAVIVYFGHPWRVVKAAQTQFRPGMDIRQIAAAFPTGYESGSIAVPMRTAPCRTESGEILPPEQRVILFPDIPEEDVEGNNLSWDARQIPLKLERMELLDKHLRDRKAWEILAQAWSAYMEDVPHPDAVAFFRRGTAYLELGDFKRGYPDIRISCHMGLKQACAKVKELPQDEVVSFEAEEHRVRDTASSCEPDLNWYGLSGPVSDDRFRLKVNVPGQKGAAKVLVLSRTELADLIAKEFKGRDWIAEFMFGSNDFRTFWFYVVVNRDGKLKEVTPITVQD